MPLKISQIEGDFKIVIREFIKNNRSVLVEDTFDREVWQEPTFTYIPELKLNVHTAYAKLYNWKTDKYDRDDDWFVFYDHNTGKQIYIEKNASLSDSIYNYCCYVPLKRWIDIEEIKDLDCFYVLNPDPFGRRKAVSLNR